MFTIFNYLDFISDKSLFAALEKLFQVYESTKLTVSERDFYNNKIDPIKLLFDTKFNNKSIEEIIELEIIRKKDKTISNAIGQFHEDLLGSIDGYKIYPVGHGYDLKSDDDSLYADIKNKHNTVKGANLKDLYKDLEKYINESSNANAKGYWVQIIAKSSFNKNWTIPVHNLNNERIYKISGDQIYKLITGRDNAFKELCEVLPRLIDDFLTSKNITTSSENTIIEHLSESAKKNDTSIIVELFNKTFDCYIGFPIKNKKP